MVAMLSARSAWPYMPDIPMHPRPSRETCGPVEPSCTMAFMVADGRSRLRPGESRSMTEHTASRTLVKSTPELWAECSDASALTRHLDHFGEIRITRLEPETAIAWEGEQVRGTVRLEPSGWGTKVTLTAKLEQVAGAEAPEVVPEPEPEPVA